MDVKSKNKTNIFSLAIKEWQKRISNENPWHIRDRDKPLENALKDRCQINMARKLVSRT